MIESLESGLICGERCAAWMQENIRDCGWETATLQSRSKSKSESKKTPKQSIYLIQFSLRVCAYHFL